MLRKIPAIYQIMIMAIICVATMASTSSAWKQTHKYLICCPSNDLTQLICCGGEVGDDCTTLAGC